MDQQHQLKILQTIIADQPNAWIELEYNSIIYDFYFNKEKLVYASLSLLADERLDRHLKRLSHIDKNIDKKVRSQAYAQFKKILDNVASFPSEYLVIEWLLNNELIAEGTGKLLINYAIKETFESYLLIPNLTENSLITKKHRLKSLYEFDLKLVYQEIIQNFQQWQRLSDHIKSPYQRPYLFKIDKQNSQLSLAQQQKLSNILKGFNFLQLEAILNQDKLLIAKKFYSLITNNIIVLRNPKQPFDKLPTLEKVAVEQTYTKPKTENSVSNSPQKQEIKEQKIILSDIGNFNSNQKKYTIVCVDDSPIILKSIVNFLSEEYLTIVPISNAAKALMMITRVKPDLILMDIGMPNIDGYQLCHLIRKHSIFQDTPIIMVTGNKGIINRAKAKLSGATDYMTKPFSQEDLLTMVFRYLND